MSANASEFYQSIVDEVVESMRSEFINEGVSEDILEKLKKTWEQKIKSKSIDAQSSRIQEMQPHPFSRGHFNYQHQVPQMYMYPHGPGYQNPYQQMQMIRSPFPFGGNAISQQGIHNAGFSAFTPPTLGRRDESQRDDTAAQSLYKSKRQRTSGNNDGLSDDEEEEEEDEEDPDLALFKQGSVKNVVTDQTRTGQEQQISQLSAQGSIQKGPANGVQVKQELASGQEQPILKEEEKDDKQLASIFKVEPKLETEREEISEEDDDDDDEEDYDDDPADFITAQYEKVQRTKQKYKCVFKDVVIHIGGKDFIVKRINADIEY